MTEGIPLDGRYADRGNLFQFLTELWCPPWVNLSPLLDMKLLWCNELLAFAIYSKPNQTIKY
eukprot:7517256-Ditylum_brightwellii.AAC.1